MSLHKLACAALMTAAVSFSAAAAPPDVLAPVVTHHTVKIGGKTVAYTAIAGDTVIRNLDDEPIGTIYSFSYIKDNPRDAHRPVLFVFDGGPGSSSLWLHMGVVGP